MDIIKAITKADWETNKFNNETLIKTNLMQIEMALRIIDLCEEKIKEYEKDEEIEKIKETKTE